jgi:hypothetical protein
VKAAWGNPGAKMFSPLPYFFSFIAIASLLPISHIATAGDSAPPMTNGWWEIVTYPEFKNIPTPPAPKIRHACLDAAAILAGNIPLYTPPACKIIGRSWEDSKLSMKITCPDAPPDAVIPSSIIVEDKSFSGSTELGNLIRYRYEGKWLSSECQ